MKLEINDKFTISYFAKKHNKRIFRKGMWTGLSREWVSKKGDKPFESSDFIVGYRPKTQVKPMSVEELYKRFTRR